MFGLFNNKKIEVGRTIQIGQYSTMVRGTDPEGSMGLGFADMIQCELAGMKGTITKLVPEEQSSWLDQDYMVTIQFAEPIGEVELHSNSLVGGGVYDKPVYEYDTGLGKPWFPALGETQPKTMF